MAVSNSCSSPDVERCPLPLRTLPKMWKVQQSRNSFHFYNLSIFFKMLPIVTYISRYLLIFRCFKTLMVMWGQRPCSMFVSGISNQFHLFLLMIKCNNMTLGSKDSPIKMLTMNGLFIAKQNQEPQPKLHKTWDKESNVSTRPILVHCLVCKEKKNWKNKNRMKIVNKI